MLVRALPNLQIAFEHFLIAFTSLVDFKHLEPFNLF